MQYRFKVYLGLQRHHVSSYVIFCEMAKRVKYGDSEYERTVMEWFDDIESEVSSSDGTDNCENGIESEHDTHSEIESCDDIDLEESASENNDNNENGTDRNVQYYYGKNNFKWSSQPFVSRSRTKKHNIISHLPGLRGDAKNLGRNASPIQIWKCLINTEILTEILIHTNAKLSELRLKYKRVNRPELQDLDIVELEAFLGLLYFSAIFKSNSEDLQSLFATDGTGRDIFRCIMSRERVLTILIALRFDHKNDRIERITIDPAAAISNIFNQFVSSCQQQYSIGEYGCVDEMLIGFRGRSKFKMYIPNKPNKYGLKVLILTDARTNYFYNGYIYTGKDSDGRPLTNEEKKLSKPTQSVLRLAQPIMKTNRNITADNWFSSIELIDELFARGITYVGTMKRNKREIPPEFLPDRRRQIGDTIYGFTKNKTLVSHVPKRGKAVVLVSSMHHISAIDTNSRKPEIIAFYNETKGGVDTLDKKCAAYSTSRRTRRWPMAVFYAILDIAGVNSFVLHQSYVDANKIERSDFLKLLAKQLVESHLNRRLCNQRLPRELRLNIGRILLKPITHENVNQNTENQRKRCGFCPRKNDKKTKNVCDSCKIPMCDNCRPNICKNCLN